MKNYKGILISVLLSFAVLAGLIGISRLAGGNSNQQAQISSAVSSGGVLAAEYDFFDFGNISMAGGDVFHVFKIKNIGSEPAIISRIYTSCMCTSATLKKQDKSVGPFGMLGHGANPKINEILNPGEEAEVEVVFDPAAHGPAGLGETQRTIVLEDSAKNTLKLDFRAVVIP